MTSRSIPAVPEGRPNPLRPLPVTFVGSFPDPLVALDPVLPEIAFVGRSNVGKSTLLNTLLGRPAARVSSTPGKTTLLNVYRLPTFYLIDLPGYGFARASQSARMTYRHLLNDCLQSRKTLTGIVWLLDIRHEPSKDDIIVQELLEESHRPVLVVLTKADKLGRAERVRQVRAIAKRLGVAEDEPLVVSATSGEGIADVSESVIAAAASGMESGTETESGTEKGEA